MLGYAVAGGIRGYQRFISPYKGFRCAYKVRFGRWSCSEYGRRLTLRLGASALLRGLPKQFARCKAAYLALMAKAEAAADRKRVRRRLTEACDCCANGCDPSILSVPLRKPGGCDVPIACDSLPCAAVPCDCSF